MLKNKRFRREGSDVEREEVEYLLAADKQSPNSRHDSQVTPEDYNKDVIVFFALSGANINNN